MVAEAEVAEGGLAGIHDQADGAAAPAVPAVGAAAGDVRLLPEGGGTVAAIAGMDEDLHPIEEHAAHLLMGRASRPGGGQGRPWAAPGREGRLALAGTALGGRLR